MTVPFIDLPAMHADLLTEMNAAVHRVLTSGRYALGPEGARLEAAMAERVGAMAAVAVSSGTDALLAALMALGVGPGDRVITTAFSFVASAASVYRLGAVPVFIDIDPVTFNLDPAAVEAWFDRHPHAAHTVKAILPVHLFGQCADLYALRAIADTHRVALVEDLAQALDATQPTGLGDTSALGSPVAHHGRPLPPTTAVDPRMAIGPGGAGLLRAGAVGNFACLSFYPTKNLGAVGEAGMVFAQDENDAAALRAIRNQGADAPDVYRRTGGNFRMDELQAALLLAKLDRVAAWTERRRALAARYDRALESLDDVTPPAARWGRTHHVYHQYVVRVRRRRDDVHRGLTARGVQSRVYYPTPLHQQPCFHDLHIPAEQCPHANVAADQVLALPMHPYLSDAQQDRVIDALTAEVTQ